MAIIPVSAKRRATIVSVTARKVDAREFEARELVKWLRGLSPQQYDQAAQHELVMSEGMDAVAKLTKLADDGFRLYKFFFDKDHMRVFSDIGVKWFSCSYMEWFPETDNDVEHYESMNTQSFPHVVDTFKALKLRMASLKPENEVRV